MRRICKKCSFVNENAGITIEAACPQCGGIYAKTDVAAARVAQAATLAEEPPPPKVRSRTAERVFWALTIVSSTLGALLMVAVEIGAKGSPQEAAGAAIAVAMAAIPYCIARAIQQYPR